MDETTERGECPVKKTIRLFQGKWNIRIIFELTKQEPLRFGELKKAIPDISNTMLTATLKNLEREGLIERRQFNEIPPHVEYALTESTKALKKVFDAMEEWGKTYLE